MLTFLSATAAASSSSACTWSSSHRHLSIHVFNLPRHRKNTLINTSSVKSFALTYLMETEVLSLLQSTNQCTSILRAFDTWRIGELLPLTIISMTVLLSSKIRKLSMVWDQEMFFGTWSQPWQNDSTFTSPACKLSTCEQPRGFLWTWVRPFHSEIPRTSCCATHSRQNMTIKPSVFTPASNEIHPDSALLWERTVCSIHIHNIGAKFCCQRRRAIRLTWISKPHVPSQTHHLGTFLSDDLCRLFQCDRVVGDQPWDDCDRSAQPFVTNTGPLSDCTSQLVHST